MSRHEHLFHLKVTLPVFVLITIVFGAIFSYLTNDPHCLNRAGALIAAIAAAAILLQISAEIQLEEERGHLEEEETCVQKTESISPLDNLELRLKVKQLEEQRNEIAKRRLHVASYVISTAMLGEFLHGFGDLIMCNLFHVCVIH